MRGEGEVVIAIMISENQLSLSNYKANKMTIQFIRVNSYGG